MVSETFWDKDGTYSYIVLVTIILSHFTCTGYVFGSAGVFTAAYPEVFNEDKVKTNIIGSTLVGVFLLSVPINTLLMKVIGVRLLAAVGSILIITGMVLSAYATQIWHLVLSYSIVTSIGMCMNMTATIGVVPHYFDRRKGAAYAGTGLGSGMGTVLYPLILSKMLEKYGYANTVLSVTPISLMSIAAIIVFKPQLEQKAPKSIPGLAQSYITSFRHLVTPFFLANAFLCRGAQVGMLVVLFSLIRNVADQSAAIMSSTVLGLSFLVGAAGLTLLLLKFKINHLKLTICCNFIIGATFITLGLYQHPLALHILSGIFGFFHGVTISIKPSISAHLYPTKDVEYSFGVAEAASGIASFLFPLSTGVIQKSYGESTGALFLGVSALTGGLILLVAAICKPVLWTPYESRVQTTATDCKDLTSGTLGPTDQCLHI